MRGIIPGPRIRPCGHHLGTTGDLNDSRRWWRHEHLPGTDLFADGPDALRRLVREQVRHGVEIVKVFASSGRGYHGRTLRNFDRDELAAVVAAAHGRGIKVRAHVCTREMIRECIALGVDILDHGDEMDEALLEEMAERELAWVPSLTYLWAHLELGWDDEEHSMEATFRRILELLPRAHQLGVRILVGDDYSGVFRGLLADDPLDHQVGAYGREIAFYAHHTGLGVADVLCWATRNPGTLLVDPPERVGVLEAGALADLIVVAGDPEGEPELFAHPERHLAAVLKGGEWLVDRLRPARQPPGVRWP
ncbi:MAG: hypothetical protein KatS3mg124_0639 [Porticoccaceae bacterium]|nr:MAG: hypothetical protein KatS3mg124_0639 [Porticoccaceae bacterium]